MPFQADPDDELYEYQRDQYYEKKYAHESQTQHWADSRLCDDGKLQSPYDRAFLSNLRIKS